MGQGWVKCGSSGNQRQDPCDLPRRSHAQTEARANSDSNTSTETATSTATATTAIFAQKIAHGRTRPSSNGVEPWSHGMEPWLFRPMAWSHGCFGHSLWRGAMAVSAISLREQIKPKRQTDSITTARIGLREEQVHKFLNLTWHWPCLLISGERTCLASQT